MVEDVVQEAFISALGRLDDLRNPEAFPGWFRQIVRTQAARIRRKRHEVPLEGGTYVAASDSPDKSAERAELRELVREALLNLPDVGRETTELFYFHEHSCSEISDMLSVPVGTVKRRLHDARKRLRGMLLGYVGDESFPVTRKKKPERELPM